MSDHEDRTKVNHGSVDIGGPRLAPGWSDGDHLGASQTPQAQSNRAVVDAADLGPSRGSPQAEDPQDGAREGSDQARAVDASRSLTGRPTPAEPGRGGAFYLTREHLESCIERLRTAHPAESRLFEPERNGRAALGVPRRSVPEHDILFVGRVAAPQPPDGADRGAKPRLATVVDERLQNARVEERPSLSGSRQRTLVLSVVLTVLLIWMAYANNLFSPSPIEVPTTLNSFTRIT